MRRDMPERLGVANESKPTVLSYASRAWPRATSCWESHAFGANRAFPYEVLKEKLVQDRLGSEPVMVVVGPDGRSVRVFLRRIAATRRIPEFYRVAGEKSNTSALLMDDVTGSEWNFQGCAVSGEAKGRCLEPVEAIKDYWFDWRHYNPATTVYGRTRKKPG